MTFTTAKGSPIPMNGSLCDVIPLSGTAQHGRNDSTCNPVNSYSRKAHTSAQAQKNEESKNDSIRSLVLGLCSNEQCVENQDKAGDVVKRVACHNSP